MTDRLRPRVVGPYDGHAHDILVLANENAWPKAVLIDRKAQTVALPFRRGCPHSGALCRDYTAIAASRLPEPVHLSAADGRYSARFAPSDRERLLFLSVLYRPEWRATAAAAALRVVPIADAFVSVIVPPGVEEVELRFVPRVLIALAWFSGGVLMILLVGVGLGEASRVWRRLRRFSRLKMITLSGKRVVVTGGAGFLGRRVAAEFRGCGAEVVVARKTTYDLVHREACRRLLADTRPDIVVHLAARVGGIGANRENPGLFFFDNLMMGVQLVEECRLAGVPKVVTIGTICSVPEAHTSPVQGGRALGRIPGGDERTLRPRQEDAARPGAGVPAAVRDERDSSAPGEPLRARRQFRPRDFSRDPRPYRPL